MGKAKVKPVEADIISDIVAKMAEERATTYRVADNAEIDWCPCCGVNIRLLIDGKMFAKFVCSPAISRQIGAKLLAMAHRSAEIQSDPEVWRQATADVLAACRKPPQ